jgi:hypothetical protein
MADNPTINGHRYGWASVEFHVEGDRFPDITEITYSTSGEPGKVRGTGMRVVGRTRGEADHEGSVTMNKSQANRFIASLGDGFMLKSFNIDVHYKEDMGEGSPITDILTGCRITNMEDSPKHGPDGLTVKFDLHILRIYYDGYDPFEDNDS